jgi:endoglucanase
MIPGPSGFEDAVAVAIEKEVSGLGETSFDSMGNLVLRFAAPDGAPCLMLMAHMDEVGLLVKYVDEAGLVYSEANGLIDERTLLATQVDIWTDQGPRLGVVGVKSRHLLSEAELRAPLAINDLWIDVGAASLAEATDLGIQIGQPITFHPTLNRFGDNVITSKSIDDRAGCSALVEVAHAVGKEQRDFELQLVWSTQEEIGSRGARVAAQWLQPTIAVVTDTTPANDVSTPRRHATAVVGGGPVVRAQDSRASVGTIYSVAIRRLLHEVAETERIPYQRDVFPTWTDACGVHLAGRGIPTGGVYIPRRCSHSPNEVIDLRDLDRTAALLTAFVRRMNAATIEQLAARPVDPLPTVIPAGR